MRTTLSPIIILATFLFSFTQQAYAQGFKMGLSLTPNVSWMNSTDYDHLTDGTKLNFGFEFTTDIMFNDTYAFGTGIHIFNTGGAISYLVVDEENSNFIKTVERDYMLKYVELPLTFKLRTKEMGYSTIYGRFGLGLGMNIRAEANETSYRSWRLEAGNWTADEYSSTNSMEDVQSEVKLFRASMIVGVGIERSLGGESSLIIGLNYNSAFINIHKDVDQVKIDGNYKPEDIDGTPKLGSLNGHDSSVSLSVGLLF
jgi:hypothetical protein